MVIYDENYKKKDICIRKKTASQLNNREILSPVKEWSAAIFDSVDASLISRVKTYLIKSVLFLLGIFKRPSLDGDVPFFKEGPEVFFVDTEMSTWQPVGL